MSKDKELDKVLRKVAEENSLGSTNEFPDGKLDADDEGEISVAVGVVNESVIINFGKPVRWIGFTADQAIDLAKSLLIKAAALKMSPTEMPH